MQKRKIMKTKQMVNKANHEIKFFLFILILLNGNCNINKEHIKHSNFECESIKIKNKGSVDDILTLLHDSIFLSKQKRDQVCFIHLITSIGNKNNYKCHYQCSFSGCYYKSIWVNDSIAFLFRFDLRRLMTLNNFADSSLYLSKYYYKFNKMDSIEINKYAKLNGLHPLTLEPISLYPDK